MLDMFKCVLQWILFNNKWNGIKLRIITKHSSYSQWPGLFEGSADTNSRSRGQGKGAELKSCSTFHTQGESSVWFKWKWSRTEERKSCSVTTSRQERIWTWIRQPTQPTVAKTQFYLLKGNRKKSNVLRRLLRKVTVRANLKSSGSLFQPLGAQKPKAASPDFQLTLSLDQCQITGGICVVCCMLKTHCGTMLEASGVI